MAKVRCTYCNNQDDYENMTITPNYLSIDNESTEEFMCDECAERAWKEYENNKTRTVTKSATVRFGLGR